jgi:monoamine oxidase
MVDRATGTPAPAPGSTIEMEIVVAGAGLAGLTAAWRLEQRGHRTTVLEARDRVGGRTFSQVMPDGTVVERGGDALAGEHTAGPGAASMDGAVASGAAAAQRLHADLR